MNIETEFDNYMRATNPAVTKGSAQYQESRRVWYAALWSVLTFISSPESTEDAVINLMAEVGRFPKYINQPKN